MKANQRRERFAEDRWRIRALGDLASLSPSSVLKLGRRQPETEEEKVSGIILSSGRCCSSKCKSINQQATNQSFSAITNIIKRKQSKSCNVETRDEALLNMTPPTTCSGTSTSSKTMYTPTTTRREAQSNRELHLWKRVQRKQQPARRYWCPVNGHGLAFSLTVGLLLACVGSLILDVGHTKGAFAFGGDSSPVVVGEANSNKLPMMLSSGIERSDKAASSGEPSTSSSTSTSPSGTVGQSQAQTSIVASLSSAVASAAAATVAAAAQSALAGSDARSLLGTGSGQSGSPSGARLNAHHQQRSPGIHLALKLADAIPEVPYNILHNMKKLDHAAPFYNVAGSKMTGKGVGKESSHHGLISNALASTSGSFGAEQLRALFQSPLWKRIADGYGDFTSEFRSLFRAPARPMKGPASSTTKLLRDISVPAMLMLLASAIPNDWLPVKTRRKSLLAPTTELANNAQPNPLIDPLSMSGSSELPNYSIASPFAGYNHLFPRSLNSNLGRSSGFNPLGSTSNQLTSAEQNTAYLPQAGPSQLSRVSNNGDTYLAQNGPNEQPNGWTLPLQQQQQAMQRVGELPPQQAPAALVLSGSTKRDMKPVKNDDRKPYSSPASLLDQVDSSLTFLANQPTSGDGAGQQQHESGKLMSKLMNANGNQRFELGNSYRMMGLDKSDAASSKNGATVISSSSSSSFPALFQRMFPTNARSDNQLNERHRYSLVEDSDSLAQFKASASANSREEEEQQQQQQRLSSSPSKPFLLSAMTQAISSMFNGPQVGNLFAAESGSKTSGGGQFAAGASPKLDLAGDKTTINHNKESVLRRQLVSGNNIGTLAEQRELSQLLPQSWREAVKRTMTSVQQQASTQWRSIEGQLSNWVQDKLKSLPAGGGSSASPTGSSSSPNSQAAAGAPMANIFASVSSTAMNLLGIGNKGTSVLAVPHPQPAAHSTGPNSDSSSATVNKHESPSRTGLVQPAKAALVGVSNMIVNSLAKVATTAVSSASASASSPSQGHSAASSAQKLTDESLASGASQYPTLTGAQTSQQSASPSSMAAATSATRSM